MARGYHLLGGYAAVLQTSAMVTGWAGDRIMQITSPAGRRRLHADAVSPPEPANAPGPSG